MADRAPSERSRDPDSTRRPTLEARERDRERSGAGSTHSLALHGGPLSTEDVLQLGEVLDEGDHLGLEALCVHVLHRGHLQGHLDVTLPLQVGIRPAVPSEDRIKMRKQFLQSH